MKKSIFPVIFGLAMAAFAHADTSLTINSTTPYGCLQNANLIMPEPAVTSSFTLPGLTGTGTLSSAIPAEAPTFSYPLEIYFYNYSIDLSRLSAGNHCVRLLIHFGTPEGCDTDEVWGSPGQIQSAKLATFGDITFSFAGGCLSPGQAVVPFTMFSEAGWRTNIVTIIDDYVDPTSGVNTEARINVPAIVPDIPPDPPVWLSPVTFPHYPFFQGALTATNGIPNCSNCVINGTFDFTLQLLDSPTGGLAATSIATQTVQVVNSLFNVPLPFDPISMGDGSARWLSIGIRPTGAQNVAFSPISPPLPISPAPQALYAYTAGAVADLAPGQAVTSLNGLTDSVQLQPGNGIYFGTNGNSLIINALAGVGSDRNIKTDITTLRPGEILAKLATLPIQRWRYTNEVASIRHVGPMAQDFKATFGLGGDDKTIAFVDEEGVALAAIQGLNQKLDAKDAEVQDLKARNQELEQRLTELQQAVQSLSQKK